MNLKTSKTAKFVAGVSGVAIAFSLAIGAAVAPASAATVDDLMAQITALTAQLNAMKGTSGSTMTSGSFNTDLSMGMTNSDVKMLQKVLNQSADTMVASSGAGSPGMESTYFGAKTKAAVIKFQGKKGISPTSGYVGPKTRALLNSMGGVSTGTGSTGTGTGTVTTGTGLTVMSAVQPSANLAPASASRVPFTKVTLTASNDGDVTVNGVTVERAGLAQDAVFAGIVLLDENGLQIGIAKTLNSNHQVTVGDPFVIRAGQSKTVTIAGNMASSLANYAGQVAVLNVVGVNSSATVNGSFPISGAANTINATLTLGSAQMAVSSFDPNSSQSKEVGTTGYKFAGVRVTAGSAEKVRLWSIRWNQSGSVSSNDLANVQVFVDGTAYPTVVSTDGKYYTASFGSGIVIDKGFAKDVYVQGDIVGSGAAGRTVKFDIYKTTDIYLSGETYTYGITPTAGTTGTASDATSEFTTGTPFFDGSKVTVSAGSATSIAKSPSVAAQNISINVPNQVLGGFDTDIKGEPISVQSMVFHVATSTGAGTGLLTNVSLYDQNGAVVAGPVDATYESATVQKLTFTDTVTLPIGKKTYTLKGKVPSTAVNNETFIVSTNPGTDWTNITGQTTGNTITFASGSFAMNTMTVKGAALAITVASTPVAQTVIAGSQGTLFANYQLDATQSGEDVRFASIPLKLTFTGGTANLLSSCQLWDGTTALNTGSNVVSPASSVTTGSDVTFTLDQSLTIPKGTVKTLALKCNVSGSASNTNTFNWGIQSSPSIAVTGVTSSNDVSESVTASVGQVQTVNTGSLTVSADSSSPSYGVTSAGVTGTTVGVIKYRAANEAMNLTKVALSLTNTSSSSPNDLVQVSLWDGTTQVGTATFTGANTSATSTLTSVVMLPKDTDKTLIVKADFAQIGSNQSGTQGHLIAIDHLNSEASGLQSGLTLNGSGSTSFAGVRLFKTFPVLVADTLPSNGVADGRLMRFKVTAGSNGDVGIYKFTISLATSSANVTNINIFGFTDSSYSSPISGINTGGQFLTTSLCASGCVTNSPTLGIGAQTVAAASTTVQVPAGATRYFEVRGTVAANSGATNYSVTTTLVGDSAYPSAALLGSGATAVNGFMASTTAIDATSNNKFIWSPNATGTSGTTANDWTNGYALPGLPSNGIIQTRSN